MSYFVNLKKANADNERLTAEVARLAAELSTAQAALTERDAAAESCRAMFDAAVSDLTAKLSEASNEISKLQADAKTAAQQAAEVIAAQGVDPAKLPKPDNANASADELASKIRGETDPAVRASLFAKLQSVWNSKN